MKTGESGFEQFYHRWYDSFNNYSPSEEILNRLKETTKSKGEFLISSQVIWRNHLITFRFIEYRTIDEKRFQIKKKRKILLKNFLQPARASYYTIWFVMIKPHGISSS